MKKWSVLFIAAFAIKAVAQTTTVNATVIDTDGIFWSYANVTWSYTTVSGSGSLTDTRTGQKISVTNGSLTLDSGGAMSLPGITPSQFINPTTYGLTFRICTPFNVPLCYTSTPISIGPSTPQNISLQLNASILAPRITGGITSQAYADVEVQAINGNQYYNIISNTNRCYVGGSWTACGGGGGSGTVSGQANGVIPVATASIVIGAQSGIQVLAQLPTPSAPSVTPTCPSSCTTTYQYTVIATNALGGSPSAQGTTIAGAATLNGATAFNTVGTSAVSGTSTCQVWRSGDANQQWGLVGTVICGSSIQDNGTLLNNNTPSIYNSSGGTLYALGEIYKGHVAFGANAQIDNFPSAYGFPMTVLSIEETSASPFGVDGLYTQVNWNPTSAVPSGNFSAYGGGVFIDGNFDGQSTQDSVLSGFVASATNHSNTIGTGSYVEAEYVTASNNGNASISNIEGLIVANGNHGSGTVYEQLGVTSQYFGSGVGGTHSAAFESGGIHLASGSTLDEQQDYHSYGPQLVNAAHITSSYGFKQETPQIAGGASIGTLAAIDLEPQTGATSNYQIISRGAALSQFAGSFQAIGANSVSGCSLTNSKGGSWAGSFQAGATSCTVTITPAPPTLPANGYSCWARDLTTPADSIGQTGSLSTSTATISGTVVNGDLITWGCVAF